MIKEFFEAIEALFRAVIYLLILFMGVVVATLSAYTLMFLAIRIGQFLWRVFFKESWG